MSDSPVNFGGAIARASGILGSRTSGGRSGNLSSLFSGKGMGLIKSLIARRVPGNVDGAINSLIGRLGDRISGSSQVDNYMDSFDQKTMQANPYGGASTEVAASVNSGAEKMQAIRANEFMNNASSIPRPFAPNPQAFGASKFKAEASSDPFNTFEGPTAFERAEQARILKMQKYSLGLSHQTRGSTVDDAFTRMGGTLGQEARTSNIAPTDYGTFGHTMSNNLKYANLFAGTGSGIYLKKQK
jgi:hypothetical protein